MNENAQITARTIKSYVAKVKTAVNYSINKRGITEGRPDYLTCCNLVDDLIQRQDIQSSTRNALRSALLWFFRNSVFISETSDHLAAISKLESMSLIKKKRVQGKVIPIDDLNKILDDLATRPQRSVWAKSCLYWIQSGLASGARPIEWLEAEWADPERNYLKIKNAKLKSSDPAFMRGQSRIKRVSGGKGGSITLSGDPNNSKFFRFVPIVEDQERHAIDLHLDGIHQFVLASLSLDEREKMFQKYYDACRLEFSRSCKAIWNGKKSYSFYSLRRQFAANVKAIVGSEEAAKLMGHSRADSPATGHYGKMNQAHPKFKFMRQE